MSDKKKKVVVIGGGTGSFVVLSGLKKYDIDLTAIVSMADDGGSTGVLRVELGVLPPGDIRQCLVALSNSPKAMLDLFNYRFEEGSLKGHNLGNLFLTALEKINGNFADAVKEAEEILAIKGRVVPVTLDNIKLVLETKDGEVIEGQKNIDNENIIDLGVKKLSLKPDADINIEAREALEEADLIVIASGNLYSSLVPVFLVNGMSGAIRNSKAKVLYVCNLMNKEGSTDDFFLRDYVSVLDDIAEETFIDYVLFNDKVPESEVLKRYTKEGKLLVRHNSSIKDYFKVISSNLIDPEIAENKKGDTLINRNLIRHNKEKLAEEIIKVLEK